MLRRLRHSPPPTLRAQVAAVIALLSFIPNLGVTLMFGGGEPLLLAWLLVVVLASAGIGAYLARRLVRPLTAFAAEVRAGEPQGAHPEDPAELRELRRAFARLLGGLREERARRDAFTATLIHDLKTPIIAASHLTAALAGELPPAERREIAGAMGAEHARLLRLVGQLSDAHRMERPDFAVSPAPCDLAAQAGPLLSRLGPLAHERGLRLTLCGAGQARLDPAAFERALTNLLENALRYARSRVHLQLAPGRVRVFDDGPGLLRPLRELARPFAGEQVCIAWERYTAGTAGLGLYIATRVMQAHGGALGHRRLLGHTVFTLDFPGPTPDACAGEAAHA